MLIKKISKGKFLLFSFLLFLGLNAEAQTLQGSVYTFENGEKTPLVGANVFFGKGKNGVSTDEKGAFQVTRKDDDSAWLYASFLGYATDSLRITGDNGNIEFVLSEGVELKQVTVVGNQKGVVFNRLDVGKTELITKTGLVKMACCNLSESFENSATVTVGFTDAVSGVKQVQLLGLSGLYSQLLTENVPTYRGLLSTFGWSYMPGSWMESIQISKGASSVVNGYESISGQINLEMKKPHYTEPLFINLYADHNGRYEANITSATKVAKDLYTGLLLHSSVDTGTHDYNDDGFLDMPESKFINLYNRWFYLSDKGIQSRTGFRLLADSRDAGQNEHLHGADAETGHGERYKSSIRNKGFSVENKTGFTIGGSEGKSIGIINSFNYADENLVYGRKSFSGRQNSFYSNALFTSTADSTHHYTVGVSFAYDRYSTWYEDVLPFSLTPRTGIDRSETIPGVFAEYTYNFRDKFTFIIGLREDYNNRYGWLFTPRANIRYNPSKNLVLRASAGRGYRSPNVIADNIGLLATSRHFDIAAIDNLDIERAWNFGGNITAYIPVGEEKQITVSLDYFHTQFDNQAIIDIERDRHSVFFYNLEGKSYADAVQADVSFSPFKGFDIFAAYRYNKVEITYSENGHDHTVEKPLTSRYRGLVNLAYATGLRKWVFDFTAQINGPSRIPGLNGYNSEKRYSEAFPVYFAQVTKNTKRFDIYIGSENLFDFKQKDPILNPDAPFGQDFDAYSKSWGPILGRRIYAGIRWRIGKLP
jgi:outer membrane receptor protein involved in Fe transport